MKEKLAVFDFDGTLFDTSYLIYSSYKEALKQVGYELSLTKEEFDKLAKGKTYLQWLPKYITTITQEELIEIRNYKGQIYARNLKKIKENKILFSLIETIQNSYHIAIATTSTRTDVNAVLEEFNRKDLFEYMIAREDIDKVKPDPECYDKVMEHFNISFENTIIFEDSEVGIKSARASGATVYIVDEIK